MNTQLEYKGYAINISEQLYKNKTVYWIAIDGIDFTFVSNPETAKRIAINLIDVRIDEHFKPARKKENPKKFIFFNDLNQYKRRYS